MISDKCRSVESIADTSLTETLQYRATVKHKEARPSGDTEQRNSYFIPMATC